MIKKKCKQPINTDKWCILNWLWFSFIIKMYGDEMLQLSFCAHQFVIVVCAANDLPVNKRDYMQRDQCTGY